jgi:NitT/TauT family transport system substrate-binding protein
MTGARSAILLSAICLTLLFGRAAAEVSEVRLAQQTSMGYMQFSIMDRYKLIEKYAKAAGLGDVKVFWDTFNGPNNMNDALLAGRVDFVSGGVPGLITLWEKTAGSPQEVRGVSAMSSQPFFLNRSATFPVKTKSRCRR